MGVKQDDPGCVRMRSAHSVPDPMDRLEATLTQHGNAVFARIDFSPDAP